jgi:hypothetical protein
VACLLLGLLGGCLAAAEKVAPYGAPVRFSKNRDVEFRDFSLRYLGARRIENSEFRPGFVYEDFEVRRDGRTQKVSWSSGTGVIDSASFEFAGRPYELELRGSVAQKGWLREDEVVVWPRADFRRALGARSRKSAR